MPARVAKRHKASTKRWFMYQVSSGYSGRLKAKNKRRAKKYLQETYPESVIYLLINEDSKYIKSLFRRKCG